MPRTPDRVFAALWNDATTAHQVAARVGQTPTACRIRACRMRKAGWDLVHHRRGYHLGHHTTMPRGEFARLWNSVGTVEQVAAATRRPVESVVVWARRLRREGHHLKRLRRDTA